MQKHAREIEAERPLAFEPPARQQPGGGRMRDWLRPRADWRQSLRWPLLILGPLIVAVVVGYFYVTGGRYVSTDNAYIKADKVVISADVTGPISEVAVRENQHVETGDLLFRVDDTPYRAALARAEAQLHSVATQIESLKVSYRQKGSELKLAEANLTFAERDYARQEPLAKNNYASEARLDQAKQSLDVARQRVAISKQDMEQIKAQLAGNPDIVTTQHPLYLSAEAARDTAAIDVQRTAVKAPFAGVASKVPFLGQHVTVGTAVMSIVADEGMWIEANFKETELTNVRPGQPVTIYVDTYPKNRWHGTVESLSQATGAEFSILPPQNATGNWVKVVQRIPVRIAIKPDPGQPPLRVGMSTEVDIDTQGKPEQAPATGSPAHAHTVEK